MQTILQRNWTYQSYLTLNDDKMYEVIQGDLLMVPAPSLEHQRISRDLEYSLIKYVAEKKLGEIFDAPVDVIFDDDNVVQPDIVFVSKKNSHILKKKGIIGTPDLVCEIISPSTLHRDYYVKKSLYEKFGVLEYWLIDPGNRVIHVYIPGEHGYELFSMAAETGEVKSNVIKGFSIKIEEIIPNRE